MRTREQEIVYRNLNQFREDFPGWLVDNPEIWRQFESLALQMAGKRSHYGAKSICEVIRYHSALKEKDQTFKLNNNVTADLARLFTLKHPQHKGFFEMRVRKAA